MMASATTRANGTKIGHSRRRERGSGYLISSRSLAAGKLDLEPRLYAGRRSRRMRRFRDHSPACPAGGRAPRAGNPPLPQQIELDGTGNLRLELDHYPAGRGPWGFRLWLAMLRPGFSFLRAVEGAA